ncbi:MAG: T9SS type A sorting domain-containing protein [Bacteroidota bacterium]
MREILLIIISLTFTLGIYAQTQVGNNLLGEAAADYFGSAVSLSADGNRLAIGAWHNSEAGNEAGRVRVFEENNGVWETVIGSLDGESGNRFGYAVSLSADGQRVAVGSPNKATTTGGVASGQVTVYQENNGIWTEVGLPIDGQNVAESFGNAVSLSADGRRLAVQTLVSGLGVSTGKVRIYEEVNGSWVQIGTDIDIAAASVFNTALSLSGDGNRVAVGMPTSDSATGQVNVYEYINDNWLAALVVGGNAGGDFFGQSVALSADGRHLVVGSPGSDNAALDAGRVYIYENNSNVWGGIGIIDGLSTGDIFGQAVAISADGNRVLASAPGSDENGIDAGQVSVFERDGDISWSLLGNEINGIIGSIEFGTNLAMSADGNRVAIGAWKHDENGTDSGLVQVFEDFFFCTSTSSIDVVESCGPFEWIDGVIYESSNNTTTVTLINAAGCDSIVNLDLTISSTSDIDPTLSVNEGTLVANEDDASYQWGRCGDLDFFPIAGETNQSFTPTESGFYAVMITKGGCEITSGCQSINVTSVDNQTQELAIVAFPNPASQYITIKGYEQLENPVIRNQLGQMMMRPDKPTINISSLSNGMYIITGTSKQQPVRLLFVKE